MLNLVMSVQELQLKRQLGHSDKQGVCQEQESQALIEQHNVRESSCKKNCPRNLPDSPKFFFYKNGARQGFVNTL